MNPHLKTMFCSAALSLVAWSISACADTADSAHMRHLENRVTALEQKKGTSGVINPSGKPQVRDGFDVFVTADVLLWQAHEDGLPLAIRSEPGTGFADLGDGDVAGLDWDWSWGFRLGIGYDLMHDGWDVYLKWMRIYGHAHGHAKAEVGSDLWPTLTSPSSGRVVTMNGPYETLHAHWKSQLNQLDLELGREFFISRWMTLRPHFGLRSDWIRQSLHVDYERLFDVPAWDYDIASRNKFWGIGLATGLDVQWGLGKGFSLYTDGAFAILYGFHKIDRDDLVFDPAKVPYTDMGDSYRVSRTVSDLELGVRWDRMFDNDRFYLRLQAGWEHHVYFAQNQFPRFVDSSALGDFVANQGDLTFQGWTFAARFDF